MHQNLRVAVVIPAYGEAARIGAVVASLPAWVDHIVVVDDASTDGTAEAARRTADPRLIVLQHDRNRGVGAATLTGFNHALTLGADVLVKLDGDGQMDPADLPALIDPISAGQADYVKGNRFLHSRELNRMPRVRRLGNIGLSFLAKMASGYWSIFDPTNGYVAMHAAVLPLLDQTRLHNRFFFENSLLMELGLQRAVVCDVDMPARYGDEGSHLSAARTFVEFPPLLFRGWWRRIITQYFVRDFSVASLFLVAGTLCNGFGVVWGAYRWILSYQRSVVATTGQVMLAVLPLILGAQLLLQAMVMDVQNVPREPIHMASRRRARP